MAPKRKNNSEEGSSKTTKQRRISKRVIGSTKLQNKTKSVADTQGKKQSKPKSKQNRKYIANDDTENQLDIIIEESEFIILIFLLYETYLQINQKNPNR
jgi:hypothetical protein